MQRVLNLVTAALVTVSAHGAAQVRRDQPAAAATKPRTGYVLANRINYYYEIHGQGAPLLLLHGGLGNIQMFIPNLPALAKTRQVIAVDLHGHGRTAIGDRPISLIDQGDDMAIILKQLGYASVDVMGYSLGGGVALFIAIRHPDLVGRLVVVSTPFRRNAFYPDILSQQGQVGAEAAEAMKQTPMYQLYASLAPRPEDWPRLLQKIGDSMAEDFDLSNEIRGIKATVLVVAGDADIFPPAHAVELFGLLGGGKRDGGWDGSGRPKSRLAILPGVTHYAMGSDPALAATVIPFLDEETETDRESRAATAQPVGATR